MVGGCWGCPSLLWGSGMVPMSHSSHRQRCLCCSGALGCCCVTHRAQEKEASVREVSYMHNMSGFPSSLKLCMLWATDNFLWWLVSRRVVGGTSLGFLDKCLWQHTYRMDWWLVLAWWYIRPVSSHASALESRMSLLPGDALSCWLQKSRRIYCWVLCYPKVPFPHPRDLTFSYWSTIFWAQRVQCVYMKQQCPGRSGLHYC